MSNFLVRKLLEDDHSLVQPLYREIVLDPAISIEDKRDLLARVDAMRIKNIYKKQLDAHDYGFMVDFITVEERDEYRTRRDHRANT